MTRDQRDVLAAARRRALALEARDSAGLTRLLHPDFRWTSFRGEVFDREGYVAGNTAGSLLWRGQRFEDVEIVVAGETAVLVAVVVDDVERDGVAESFRLRLTQVWLRSDGGWCCLGGHAGPRLP